MAIIINARREAYGKEDCNTMTVKELIDCLSQFNEDEPVILSHDNGYTYGGIRESDFTEEYDD